MKALLIFWRFTRPHTIIGSLASVSALFVIATKSLDLTNPQFLLSLLAALGCNIFITGYNQVVDVELDRINKPYLPIAAGDLSRKSGKRIVFISLFISLISAGIQSFNFLILIVAIAALGFIYSWKGIYLKRHHGLAALAITLVRGLLVNVGFYLHFADGIEGVPFVIVLLTAFVILFSLGIAWFKDIPDIEGDKTEKLGTLAVNMGAKKAFKAGLYAVGTAYTICAFGPMIFSMPGINGLALTAGNTILGISFLMIASRVEPGKSKSMTGFYKFFWALFVAEYFLFALSAIV